LVKAPTNSVHWPRYYRLIESKYPPIDLFEDIADPNDWIAIGSAETKSNPRVAETIGQLDLVPLDKRAGGPGASYVMAPFTHCSPDKAGRFHTGHFGAYYGADRFETALAETIHHKAIFFTDAATEPGWVSDMRELTGEIAADLVDIRGGGFADVLDPDSYAASQGFAVAARDEGALGIVYPSVRDAGGECFAAFWPNVAAIPVQARHLRYHWDGERIDMVKELNLDGDGPVFRIAG
jgi:RES domain